MDREGGTENVARVKFENNQGKAQVYILEMSPFPESIYRYFPLLLGGGERRKLIIIQAFSQVVNGHESELEG